VAYCQARDSDDQHHDQARYIAQSEMLCSEDRAYCTADQDQPYRKVDVWTAVLQEQVHRVRLRKCAILYYAGRRRTLPFSASGSQSEETSHAYLDALTTKLSAPDFDKLTA